MPVIPVAGVGATPVQVTATPTNLASGLLVVAHPANTQTGFVGNGNTVTPGTNLLSGIPVFPGAFTFVPREALYTSGTGQADAANAFIVCASGSNTFYCVPDGDPRMAATVPATGGTAGSPSAVVTTVQGVSGGTPVPVAGVLATPSASFARPADTTAYASGDLVANSTTAGSVAPMSWTVALAAGGTFSIAAARIRSSSTSLTNASYRVHLYASAPTPSNGDNGAWLTDDVADYLGAIDVTLDRVFADGSFGVGVPVGRPYIHVDLPSGTTIRGLVEARAARTPASGETLTVTLEVLQNS